MKISYKLKNNMKKLVETKKVHNFTYHLYNERDNTLSTLYGERNRYKH